MLRWQETLGVIPVRDRKTSTMKSKPIKTAEPAGCVCAKGCVANDGVERYLLEANSTTGYVAWKTAEGTILVSEAAQMSIRTGPSIEFWSCAGYQDTTPAGNITAFDCHGCGISRVDVTRLASLEYLDCSFNRLTKLKLAGLRELQVLDVEGNQLKALGVGDLQALRVLNCSANRLTKLDLSGLSALQVADCSNNPLKAVNRQGCMMLEDFRDTCESG
jgi:Leucine-rich repeat (LRR) protein